MSVLAATIQHYTRHPAPGFDNLSLLRILGWQTLARTSEFPAPDGLCVFIPPEMSVDETRPEWAFLEKKKFRIRAMKMKGIVSEGLAIPVPPHLIGVPPGTDVSSAIGAFRTPEPLEGAKISGILARYLPGLPDYPDFGRLQLTPDLFVPGEPVTVREKLHGTQARYTWDDDRLLIASHHTFRDPDSPCIYAQIARDYEMADWMSDCPQYILYGEIIGPGIQKGYTYGLEKPEFVLFDVYDKVTHRFLRDPDAHLFGFCNVPSRQVTFDLEAIRSLAEAPSEFDPQTPVREGVVIHSGDGSDPRRRSAKLISVGYLARND